MHRCRNGLGTPGMRYLLLSRACTAPRAFLLLRLPRQRAGWGCSRRWQGTQRGHLIPADQRDIPRCHTTPCSAVKQGGRWRLAGAALAQGRAGHCSLGGQQSLSFASLVSLGLHFPLSFFFVAGFPYRFFFFVILKLTLPEFTSFLPLPFPFSPCTPLRRSERVSERVAVWC